MESPDLAIREDQLGKHGVQKIDPRCTCAGQHMQPRKILTHHPRTLIWNGRGLFKSKYSVRSFVGRKMEIAEQVKRWLPDNIWNRPLPRHVFEQFHENTNAGYLKAMTRPFFHMCAFRRFHSDFHKLEENNINQCTYPLLGQCSESGQTRIEVMMHWVV